MRYSVNANFVAYWDNYLLSQFGNSTGTPGLGRRYTKYLFTTTSGVICQLAAYIYRRKILCAVTCTGIIGDSSDLPRCI